MVEVRRHGDDGRIQQIAAVVERPGQKIAQVGQNLGRNLRRVQLARPEGKEALQAHVPFDRAHGGNRAGRRRVPHHLPALRMDTDQRGHDGPAAIILARQDSAVRGVQQGDDAVGRAQVDAHGFANARGDHGKIVLGKGRVRKHAPSIFASTRFAGKDQTWAKRKHLRSLV